MQVKYEHPKQGDNYIAAKLLEGAIFPNREVEDFEIYNIERRFF